jgi:pyridoxine 4-dehydrogenase
VLTLDDTTTFAIGGDLPVRRLGFGAMRLTGDPARLDRSIAIGIARRAVELGVTLIDTADSYDFGDNEALLAEALYPYPPGVVVATKGGHVNLGHEWIPLGRPEYLRQQAELSLRRLRLERIDLYQLHRVDPAVPLADQIGALRRLQDEGKVRHVGLSEVTVDQLVEAEKITPIASVQNRYNVVHRGHDDVVEYCQGRGIAFVPWLPVAPAARSAAARSAAAPSGAATAGPTGHASAAVGSTGCGADPLTAVADRHGATRTQVALAWLLHRSPAVLPIPGTSSRAHLEQNIAAARITLTADEVAHLTGTSRLPATGPL